MMALPHSDRECGDVRLSKAIVSDGLDCRRRVKLPPPQRPACAGGIAAMTKDPWTDPDPQRGELLRGLSADRRP